jgi:ABC-2 type transport system ATP-binding protein
MHAAIAESNVSTDHTGRDVVISVRGLVKKYDQIEAVRGIDLTIERGEIFGFLGPNGAGKSTTISMLCTLLKPTAGSATVDGRDVDRDQAEVRRRIGMVFQDPSLDDQLTARENLRFHALAYGIPRAHRAERIEAALAMIDLTDRGDSQVRTFSGGMKRRLEIARGIMHAPTVLFLDEPTLGLDPQTRARVWEHLKEIHRRSRITIFMTTHYMEEAEWCDRIAIIDQGQIVALGSPAELKSQVGGDIIVISTPDNDAASEEIKRAFGIDAVESEGQLRMETENGTAFIPRLIQTLSTPVQTVTLRQPSLDDVFLKLTGRAIREEDADPKAMMRRFAGTWGGRRR